MSIENKCHSFLVKAKHSVKKIVLTYRRIAAQVDHVTGQQWRQRNDLHRDRKSWEKGEQKIMLQNAS